MAKRSFTLVGKDKVETVTVKITIDNRNNLTRSELNDVQTSLEDQYFAALRMRFHSREIKIK